MKKSTILCGALGLLALCFTACSQDISPDQTQAKAEFDQTQYIAVQISAPRDVTRTFVNGTANESAVTRLDFLFYDVAGNPTSAPHSMTDFSADSFLEDADRDNVTRMCTTVVPVNLVQGQNLPSQVICIVNGEPNAVAEIKAKTLSELINVERTYFRNGSSFVMSNSVYYGQNVLTGQANQRLCATPINANSQLFSTEEAAQKALTTEGALVDIYVERVAAKVGLTIKDGAVAGYTLVNGEGGGNVTLTFVPEYWAMNATANKNYLTKRYGVDNDGVITLIPSYGQISQALGNAGWGSWNDPANFRSYWGCSPSYFENKYPDVSDDVNDLEEGVEENYPVTYYSYNGVKTQAERTDDGGIGKQAIATTNGTFADAYIYTRETTVATKTINNVEKGNPAAAVASAILVGKYSVTGVTDQPDGGTFYVDRNAGVIEDKTVGRYYGSMTAAITALANRQSIVFTNANGTVRAAASVFTLSHPTAEVRKEAGTKLAGRLVTLQITKLPADPVFYYNINGGGGEGAYEQIDEDNLKDVNAQLLSVGYLEMFNNGHAFFSVPIRHINFKPAHYTNGTYNWKDMSVGEVGVVRNHVYNLEITKVTGLGAGVRSDEQPMVPAKEEANQYIAARINILAWNIANTWSVDL